ncbi:MULTISPECIES: PTS sugar transporter subunit IIA [Lactobacillaceae]|jgi:PTS system galactitol-specific IIA component|uniref:PTS sugar transporter subunit IIA n=2 Tax=Bacillati TaxID=1783272 RepID=A0AAW6ABN0_LACPA|nr:PTS sugar transporter subunit IIA [Lacticaseibacillus paracasei]MDB1566050.1 PTS sugar transporter subunit IIA [Lacticaseibacillus paracasei]
MYESMFTKDLVNLNVNATDANELFNLVGEDAHAKGYANADYVEGLKKREQSYPTGLIFQNLELAIPHVDPEYVVKPFIYVARTTKPIAWLQMGDSKEMSTKNFLFLGIKEPQKQVGLLSAIIASFQDADFISDFISATDADSMTELLKAKFTDAN